MYSAFALHTTSTGRPHILRYACKGEKQDWVSLHKAQQVIQPISCWYCRSIIKKNKHIYLCLLKKKKKNNFTWTAREEAQSDNRIWSSRGRGKKHIKATLNQSDGQSSFFYWQIINSLTLQRLIQGCIFRPRLSSCQKKNKIHTDFFFFFFLLV